MPCNAHHFLISNSSSSPSPYQYPFTFILCPPAQIFTTPTKLTRKQQPPRNTRPPRTLPLTNDPLNPNHRDQPARLPRRRTKHFHHAKPPAPNPSSRQRQRKQRHPRDSRPSRSTAPPARPLRRGRHHGNDHPAAPGDSPPAGDIAAGSGDQRLQGCDVFHDQHECAG